MDFTTFFSGLNESTLQFIAGATTTLLGSFAAHYFTIWRAEREERKRKAALRKILNGIILSYANYKRYTGPWSNSLWDKHHFDIAMYFPDEVCEFYKILNTPDTPHISGLTANQIAAAKLASKLSQSE